MIISNLHSWNHATSNQNSALNRSSLTATHTEANTVLDSAKTAPRTIVFCKLKAPEVYQKVAVNNNTNMKLKKLVKFEENSQLQKQQPIKKSSLSTDSKTMSTEISSRNFQSNSVNDLTNSAKQTQKTQQQIQKTNLSNAIGKKLMALNRFNSANSCNRLSLKENIHSSYLTGGGVITNPFASNLDMITKSNPNYSSLNYSSKLVNRLETSGLSRMDHYSSQSLIHPLKNKETPSETNYNQVYEVFSKNDDSSNRSISRAGGMSSNELNKLNSANNKNLTMHNDKSEKKIIPSSNDTKNYFLTYRLIKSDKENILNNIKLNNEYKNNLKNKSQATATQLQPSKFEDDSSNDLTGHKYLESLKFFYIKNWIEEVEKCQRIEGKCLETMNKITFYDD
jgi:hypothetical protein